MLNWLRQRFAVLYAGGIIQKGRNDVAILESWQNVPMGCCDCGLIHRFDFWVNGAGQLCVRGRRDVEMTAAIRTVRRFPFSHHDSTVPIDDVHPANVRVSNDPRDRAMRFTDRRAAELLDKAAREARPKDFASVPPGVNPASVDGQ